MKYITYTVLLLAVLLLVAGCQINGTGTNATNESTNNATDLNISVSEPEPTDTTDTTTPITGTVPVKTITEGDILRFKEDIAYDPDGDDLDYTFTSPLNSNGDWETKVGDAGSYPITVTVSDGKLQSTQDLIIVVKALNGKPVITNFGDLQIKEGELIILEPIVSDPEGDKIILSYSGYMTTDTYQTTFDDAGIYEVVVTANDGFQKVTESRKIIIKDVNRGPVITGIDSTISVKEGDKATIPVDVNDPDGDAISISFDAPFNKDGNWQTENGDAGSYDIDVTISDGDESVVKTVRVVVEALNYAPVLKMAGTVEVDEGQTIRLEPEVSDTDGDTIKVTYTGYMTTSQRATNYDDAGEFSVTVTASDGKESVSKDVVVIVNNVNRPPQFLTDDVYIVDRE
jgi:nitrogen fixation protein FixH